MKNNTFTVSICLILAIFSLVYADDNQADAAFAAFQEQEQRKYQRTVLMSENAYEFLDRSLFSVQSKKSTTNGVIAISSFGGNYSATRYIESFGAYIKMVLENKPELPIGEVTKEINLVDIKMINSILDKKIKTLDEFAEFINRNHSGSRGYKGKKARDDSEETDDFYEDENPDSIIKLKNDIEVAIDNLTPRQIREGEAKRILRTFIPRINTGHRFRYNGFNISLQLNVNPINPELENLIGKKKEGDFIEEILRLSGSSTNTDGHFENGHLLFPGIADIEYQGRGFFRQKSQLVKHLFLIDENLNLIKSEEIPGKKNKSMTFSLEEELEDGRVKAYDREVKTTANDKGNEFSVFSTQEQGIQGKTVVFGDTVPVPRAQIDVAVNWSPLAVDHDQNSVLDVKNGEWISQGYFAEKNVVLFDCDNDGIKEWTEWIGPNDALLVMPNEKGEVLNSDHLFGNKLGLYENGYHKLQVLHDKNNDFYIQGDELRGIFLWFDKNTNAIVDDGELMPIQQAGIEKISVIHNNFSSFCILNGKITKTWDWWPMYKEQN